MSRRVSSELSGESVIAVAFAAGAAPRRPQLAEVGPGQAQQQERRARPLSQILDEVEQARFGPVHVLEDEDQRRRRRAALEVPPQPERELLAQLIRPDLGQCLVGALDPGEHAHPFRDGARVFNVVAEGVAGSALDLFDRDVARVRDPDPGVGADDELDRVIRDALSVGEAAARANVLAADRLEKLGREP